MHLLINTFRIYAGSVASKILHSEMRSNVWKYRFLRILTLNYLPYMCTLFHLCDFLFILFGCCLCLFCNDGISNYISVCCLSLFFEGFMHRKFVYGVNVFFFRRTSYLLHKYIDVENFTTQFKNISKSGQIKMPTTNEDNI